MSTKVCTRLGSGMWTEIGPDVSPLVKFVIGGRYDRYLKRSSLIEGSISNLAT